MNDQPTPRRQRSPLTVVVWVLGVLVVGYIAWGVGTRAYHASRKATCLSNISQLAKAMRLYAIDYNEYLFFDHADAFSPPLAPGHYGQTQYLKEAMAKYVPDPDIWYCPADPFARKDFSCDSSWLGSFTYGRAGIRTRRIPRADSGDKYIVQLYSELVALYGKDDMQIGYTAIPHADSRDPGIVQLYSELVALYGKDDTRVDHAFSSYRYYPYHSEAEKVDGAAVYIDIVKRVWEDRWGAHGYWDVNPSSTWVFEEDLSFHFTGAWPLFGTRVYGRTWGFRDGHAVFHTYGNRGVRWGTGELNEAF